MDNDSKQGNGALVKWFGIMAIGLSFIAIASYVIWPRLQLETPADLIIVKAVDGPIKIKPTDPGGKTVAYQDLLVIDMLKSGVANTGDVETLRPAASNPEPPPINGDGAGADTAPTTPDETAKPVTEQPVDKMAAADDAPKTQTESDTKIATPLPKPTPKKPTTQSADDPLFVIQLAAFRSKEKAEEIANLLSEKHASRLGGMRLQTMQLDTGTNGIFFRVVSAPLGRDGAEAACTRLRRAGQDCFLRKFTAPGE